MKLVTIDRPHGGHAGALLGDAVLDLRRAAEVLPICGWIPSSVAALIAAGEDGASVVRRAIDLATDHDDHARRLREIGALTPRASTRLSAPVPTPGILLSHGRAYRSHVEEMAPGAKPTGEPIGFMKNVHAIIGPDAPIVLPAAAPDMVDFEAEISVVFSRPCHGVSADDALDHVFGFTIVNDVSARNWVERLADQPELNRMGKQFQTFAPMGPCVATLDEIADPSDVRLVTRLNGEVMQDASTRDLIWSLPELIAYYSRWYPFRAGDVMTTGTPAGVGYGRSPKVFMRPGDVISITVDGVGELSNPVTQSEVVA